MQKCSEIIISFFQYTIQFSISLYSYNLTLSIFISIGLRNENYKILHVLCILCWFLNNSIFFLVVQFNITRLPCLILISLYGLQFTTYLI